MKVALAVVYEIQSTFSVMRKGEHPQRLEDVIRDLPPRVKSDFRRG